MKKMTTKEFKEILREIGCYAKADNFGFILNDLVILYEEKSKTIDDDFLKDFYKKQSMKLFKILNERGYYED